MFYKGYEYQTIIKALKFKALNSKWSGKQDLNLQPLGPKPSALPSCAISRLSGAPEGIRTPDLLVRSQTLYPAELRAQAIKQFFSNTLLILTYFNNLINTFYSKLLKYLL